MLRQNQHRIELKLRFKSIIRCLPLICIVAIIGCTKEPQSSWTHQELRTLASFQLSRLDGSALPPSNRYALNADAAVFGKQLFFDARLSLDGTLSCASCHLPERAFTDGRRLAQGIQGVSRNTQTLLGAAHSAWFYWDGRKDSLWSQALIPFEAPDEMGSSRVQLLRVVGGDAGYKDQYQRLFGEFPNEVFDTNIYELSGPWGNTQARNNWAKIPSTVKEKINRAFVNIGKSIAAYERTLPLPETKFDRYLDVLFNQGAKQAKSLLSNDEYSGLKLFLDESKTHCMRCHNGPLFTNNDFHNIGTGNFDGKTRDFGRFLGLRAVMQDEFNCLGRYSDADPEQCLELRFLPKHAHGDTYGAFKTPSLRYLNKTGPYFHDGRFTLLEQVMSHYTSVSEGETELPKLLLSSEEMKQLLAFLNTLNID